VSKKSAAIAALIESCQGRDLDAHYLGYFACFNQGLYYEAHDVLEELWLADRRGGNGDFYKGLIQLAGAFVLLQKDLTPAARLFKLARANLQKYATVHEHLEVADVLALIENWVRRVEEADFKVNPLNPNSAPQLSFLDRPVQS
jgi:predicted metal-dependent hydrolase